MPIPRPAILTAILLTLLAGCASDEYSKMPEPTGEWIPANPPLLAPPMLAPIPLAAAAGSVKP